MKRANGNHDGPEAARTFDTTEWSVVLAARGQTAESADALARLCEAYWLPLYVYVRRRVQDVHEAQDLTQEFFATLLEKEYLADADPTRGRFRAFLLTAFKHFLSKQWDKGRAQKRGGDRTTLSLDFAVGEERLARGPRPAPSPDEGFQREWALMVTHRALEQLAQEYTTAGKQSTFHALKPMLTTSHGETDFAAVAAELSTTVGAVRVATHRLRQRYGHLLRQEVARTVSDSDEVDREIRDLFAALASPGSDTTEMSPGDAS